VQDETSRQQVQALEIGIVACPSSAVAVASSQTEHSLFHPSGGDERGSLEREPEHLQIRDLDPTPELSGEGGAFAGCVGITLGVGDVALVEGEPTVVGPRLERIEQPVGTLEPAARDRRSPAEVELVSRQPGRHAGGAGRVSALPVEPKRALACLEHRVGVVEPPRRPAQALEGLRHLFVGERFLEGRARFLPSAVS
jgi:hypothetical protein